MLALSIGFIYYLVFDKHMLPLLRQPLVQALFIGATLVITVLWSIQAKLDAMPPLHFLGITALVLLLGLRLSLLATPLAIFLPLLASYWLTSESWPATDNILLQWLALIVTAIQCYLLYWWSERKLSNHLFVRIFVCGFFNAMLSAATYMLAMACGYLLLALLSSQQALDYLTTIPLLALPEALLNGMTVSVLLVYRPHWLAAFRDNEPPDSP